MSTELAVKAQDKVALTRLPSGELSFHRYTLLAGVRFVVEKSDGKDITQITVDEFARAFHGVATKTTRRLAKNQIRRLIPELIDDGWMVVPDYEDRKLSGLVYVRSIPDDDDGDVADMIASRIKMTEHQRDVKHERLTQLKENLRKVMNEQ